MFSESRHTLTVVTEMSRGVRLEFAVEDLVGVYQRGVIIKEKAHNTLHEYELQLPEMIYRELWSEDFPHGVNAANVMAVGRWETFVLLQDKNTSTTLVLSHEGKKRLGSWHQEGILLNWHDSSYENLFMYAVEKTYGEYEIVIVNRSRFPPSYSDNSFYWGPDRDILRLQPVGTKPTWSHPYLSVCENDRGKRIAVTSTEHTLDIYSKDVTSK